MQKEMGSSHESQNIPDGPGSDRDDVPVFPFHKRLRHETGPIED
jgi:hypothetical protein